MLYSAEMQEMREMGGIRITRCTEGLKTKPTAFNTIHELPLPLYLYLLYYLLPSLSVLGKRGLGGHRRGLNPSSGARGSSAHGRMF